MQPALMIRSILLLGTLACGACVGGPPIVTANAAACSSLIPPDWREGVAGAELPDGSTIGDWIAFGDAQTARLDQANGRTRDAVGIVERCEQRDAAAVRAATRRQFLGIF